MKNCLFIFLLILPLCLSSETAADLSSRIVIDGYSDEFMQDESMIVDSLGNDIEPDNDSYWGIHNDINQIKITWDQNYLYAAVDGCSWDNNVILFLDVYDDYGIENMETLNSWARKFNFFNFSPDFFLATWDRNQVPQFWKVNEGTHSIVIEITNISTIATFDTGQLGRSMEAAIPWETIYFEGQFWDRKMENYPKIKIAALITAGDDYTSGPDVAPDNISDMQENSTISVNIDNYLEFTVDADKDNEADLNVSPNDWERINYFKLPQTFIPQKLKIKEITFPNGKVFNPYQDEPFQIQIESNQDARFSATVFDVAGEKMKELSYHQTQKDTWIWDGKDEKNKIVPFGFYIIQIRSSNHKAGKIAAFSVIK